MTKETSQSLFILNKTSSTQTSNMAATQNVQCLRLEYPSSLSGSGKSVSLSRIFFFPFKKSIKPPLVSLQNHSPSKEHSFTVTYLVNSCGLSLETAISLSKKLQLHSPEKPNLVLSLLRNNGFSKTHISKLVSKRPLLLLANPHSTLLPKLEFFHSIGFSQSELARTLSSDPTLLTRSLDNQIIPSYNYLKTLLLSNEQIVTALKHTTWIFLESKNLVPNISFLNQLGVSQKCIALMLTHFPVAVMQKHDQFCEIVREVKGMGFEPKKSTFVVAVHAKSGKGNKSRWERCCEVYRRWGWSKDDIFMAFRKHPHCMMLSEKKIMKNMDFFVNKIGCSSRVIAQCPVVLFFSLEKRIIPRFSVIQVLMSKGLVKQEFSLTTVLMPVEKCFLERFVTKYQDEVPELLGVYLSGGGGY